MGTLLLASLFGLIITLAAVGYQVRRRKIRRQRLKGLELKPNCLLTRYPIVFIGGRRSVFRLFDHWNDIPSFLREHGYDVLMLEPVPGRHAAESLLAALDNLPGRCHFIADTSSEVAIKKIAATRHSNIASVTLVRARKGDDTSAKEASLTAADLRPTSVAIEVFQIEPGEFTGFENRMARLLLAAHNLLGIGQKPVDPIETAEVQKPFSWCLESKFLDLAISLAERDARWSD